MKKEFWLIIVTITLGLYACGGNTNSSTQSGDEIDVTQASDSKGVGEFTSVTLPEEIDPDMTARGKELFQASCMVCHQVGSQDMIGPGLKGVTKIRTPEWILNMIVNPDKMLDEDPVAKALLKKYSGTRMTRQGINKDQARQILEYLRFNDSKE